MSSTHVVPVVEVNEIKPHPNADKLEIAIVGGWQVLTGIGNHNVGDRVVHIPPDSIVPEKWADEWKVRQYLAGKTHNRVKCIKLRGEPSFGFLVPVPDDLKDVSVGTDTMEFFGIEKYLPPMRGQSMPQGQARKSHPLFSKYTGIENFRNYTNLFRRGEPVIFLEKIHGSNVRLGLVNTYIKRKDPISLFLRLLKKIRTRTVEEWVAGSHNVPRKIGENPSDSPYTFLMSITAITNMIRAFKDMDVEQVIVYAEVYGSKIQKLTYGVDGYTYAVFDIKIDGEFLNWSALKEVCDAYGVSRVPVLYEGAFSADLVKEYGSGKSIVDGADNIREGLVIRPVHEDRTSAGMRKILKYKGIDYLLWSGQKGNDYTEE
jgi:RNA ligase (TIGR02306 family)